uniref:Uncharacterized protein n=1 Tax=Setaria italica TaxID=4555 RepID=K4ANY1_SETIT
MSVAFSEPTNLHITGEHITQRRGNRRSRRGQGKTKPTRPISRLAGGRHRHHHDQHPRTAPPRIRPGLRLHGRLRPPPAPRHLPLPRRSRRIVLLLPAW